ncbi:MAG: 3-isopropylmalate dehydratase small subunit [Alphaproteobacteria bacterium]|nr:3-isopropylmalate dehydratase small subunit [Alphaproteobacteria bacterium]
MDKFTELTGIAAPLPMVNVDTDKIIPKQFLKTIKRTGLKDGLFYDLRNDLDGNRIDDFVLHRAPYDKAKILIAGDNFGCGSSREHAPWALLDFGIRCVIAPSFADIFYNNCFKNGILPVALPQDKVDALMKIAEDDANPELNVDLVKQEVRGPNGLTFSFELDAFRKKCLLEGLDDIALTLQKEADIAAFEDKHRQEMPWLYQQSGN